MLKKHPKGMVALFFTEMWERFGFYTLMAILTLYMQHEFKWDDSQKGDVYGIFLGIVYFFPLLGGWLGDKVLGQITSVWVGSILMIFGYILLGLSNANIVMFFFAGLFLVALGTGIFKVNISVLVGNLYRHKPELKDAGFNIYYMGVNIGATIAPLAATAISIIWGSYNISFFAAAFGMFLCTIIFQAGRKNLILVDTKSTPESFKETHVEMPKAEFVQRIVTLIILFLIASFFWIGFYQNGFALTLFAERSTIESEILRPETYQFFNPFFILVLTPLLLGYFAKLNKKGKS